MVRTLKALARRRGDDPAKVALAAWKNHDVRRSVRSQLSRVKTITEETREAVLPHVRPGIKGPTTIIIISMRSARRSKPGQCGSAQSSSRKRRAITLSRCAREREREKAPLELASPASVRRGDKEMLARNDNFPIATRATADLIMTKIQPTK
jgi:hypothetical protein